MGQCKSDIICPYLQSSTLFKWLLKSNSWEGLSKKWVITAPKGNVLHLISVRKC